MKYEFSLNLSNSEVTDQDADKLYEAGCGDASILTRDGVSRLQIRPRPRESRRGGSLSHPERGARRPRGCPRRNRAARSTADRLTCRSGASYVLPVWQG